MKGITKIELEIGDKKIELTYGEAKELKEILTQLFKVEVREVVKEVEKDRIVPVPSPYPVYPTWPYRKWEPIWYRYEDGSSWTYISDKWVSGGSLTNESPFGSKIIFYSE